MLNRGIDPRDLLGKELPAADGGDYGARVLAYDAETEEYLVETFRWSTGELLSAAHSIDAFKITYRYVPEKARSREKENGNS